MIINYKKKFIKIKKSINFNFNKNNKMIQYLYKAKITTNNFKLKRRRKLFNKLKI